MQTEQEHRENVKARNERMRKADDHHRVEVVVIERIEREGVEAGIGSANREMEDMINDEGKEDQPAHYHAAGGKSRFDRFFAPVTVGARAAVFDRKPDRIINMEEDSQKQPAPNDPDQHTELAQFFGVAVDPLRSEENLEVSEEVTDDEKNQDQARGGRDHFPSDR